ncbi:hypothetical protein BX666DRAFT_1915131 [Dichotomocladium elegans]|nr:hypothetical protein BX666DRAFT_1915131 [Dichotomocladium elegans]
MSNVTDRYLEWLRDNQAVFEKFELKNDEHGIGSVYAGASVEPGETLATLPFRLAITEPVARNQYRSLSAYNCRIVMSVFVAQQKKLGASSFYWPYLAMLPEKIMTALHFDDQDMQFLANTPLAISVAERKAEAYRDYELVSKEPVVVENGGLTWDEYLWGYSVLSSRSFPYKLIDPKAEANAPDSEVLFPLLDQLNHKPNTKITWLRTGDPETGTLSFVAGEAFSEGEQLFNNYGPKSNEELLLGYGFCFDYNEFDHVALKPNFSQDPNGQLKLQILSQAGVASGNESDPLLYYVHRNNVPASFWKLMRVLVMNPIETQYYAECTNASEFDFIGYRNELAMLSTVQKLLQSRLMNVNNCPADRNAAATAWQRYALMYRDGQQDVLNHVLGIVEQVKLDVMKRMARETLAPNAPFLGILNPGHFSQNTCSDLQQEPMVMLESVTITLNVLLQRNPALNKAFESLFEDMEEEQDVVMMLALIKERSKQEKSKWHTFFEKTR